MWTPCRAQAIDSRLDAAPVSAGRGEGGVSQAAASRPCPAPSLRTLQSLARSESAGRLRGATQRRFWLALGPRWRAQAIDHLSRLAEDGDLDAANDLAVGWLERALDAGGSHRHLDLVRALDRISAVLEERPGHPAALYNRALVLDHLHLVLAAEEAWGAAIEADPPSPWADEAAVHRSRLRLGQGRVAGPGPGSWRVAAFNRLAAMWPEHVPAPSAEAFPAEASPAEAFSAETELFSEWPSGGDGAVVETLERLASLEEAEIAALEPSMRAFADGWRAFADRRFAAAREPLEAARSGLEGWPLEPWLRVWLAFVEISATDYPAAHRWLSPVLAAVEASPALRGRAQWARGLAAARLQDYPQALEAYGAAARAFESIDDHEGVASVYGQAADVLRLLGQNEEAWSHRLRSLASVRTRPLARHRYNTLWESGLGALEADLPLAAAAFQREGLAVAEFFLDAMPLAESRVRFARTLAVSGHFEEASAQLAGARAENARIRDAAQRERNRQSLLLEQARLSARARPAEALTQLDALLESLGESLEMRRIEALQARAEALAALGRAGEAVADLEAAVGLVESALASAERRERRTLQEAAGRLYDAWIEHLAVDLGDPVAALAVLERSRSLAARPSTAVAELAETWRRLPAESALAVFAWVRGRVYRWLLRPGGLDLFERSESLPGLENRLGVYLESMKSGAEGAALAASARDLHHQMLGSMAGHLADGESLFVVPDRVLAGFPLATLRDPSDARYLIEERALGFAPSLSVLRRSFLARRSLPPGSSGLIVADPAFEPDVHRLENRLRRLPFAARSASQLVAIHGGGTVLAGDAATVEALEEALADHRFLHFAGHAWRDEMALDRSFLVLAGEAGLLDAERLAALAAPHVDLAVLAACSSGATARQRSSSHLGLAASLLDAGVPAVLGTFWPIDDRRGAALFIAFHRALARGEGFLEASRSAQLELLHSEDSDLSRPEAWAALQPLGYLENSEGNP